MSKLLVATILFVALSAPALADDKTADQPLDQQKLKEGPIKATEERSTGKSGRKGQPKALPLKGGFGPAGGRAERNATNQRMKQEREQSEKAWSQKYGPDDQAKKGPGQ